MLTILRNRNPILIYLITANNDNDDKLLVAVTETDSVIELIVSYTLEQGIPQGAMLMLFLFPLYNSNSLSAFVYGDIHGLYDIKSSPVCYARHSNRTQGISCQLRLSREKQSSWFPTKLNSNQSEQLMGLARGLESGAVKMI